VVDPGGEPSADPGRAEFGVDVCDGVGELLAGDFVAVGFAFGIAGGEVGAGGHQLFVFLTGFGALDSWLGVEVPALAALGHP
jgi:hypothetical protein